MRRVLLLGLIFISCHKDETPVKKEYFLSAIIDGLWWERSANNDVGFATDYDNIKKRFRLNIVASDPTPNVKYRIITIGFDFVPKKGHYVFNNTGSLQNDSGIIAIITYRFGPDYSYKWTVDGYVDVDTLTKEYVKGKFAARFRGDATDTSITTLTNGLFVAPYSGSSGLPWPGP